MEKPIIDKQKVDELLGRYVQEIYPSREKMLELLTSGKRLHIYLGIDPTGPHIHLGHATNLFWLKKLIALGHQATLLMGDFTARIGDPTGRETTRKILTKEEVDKNMETYLEQVYKILEKGSFSVKYNSSWLSKLSAEDFIKLARHISVLQMLERDMFVKSIWHWKCSNCKKISKSPIQFSTQKVFETATLKNNTIKCPHCREIVGFEKKDILSSPEFREMGMQEFLYPLMQGYDSVAMKVDGEVGGRDQTFNMLFGRELEKSLLGKEKIVITTVLLEDKKTGKKIMNKSEGTTIALDDEPQEIRRKVLLLDDGMIKTVFELCTEKDMDEVSRRYKELEKEGNLRQFKEELSDEVVKMLCGEDKISESREPSISGMLSKGSVIDFLVDAKIVASRSEAKHLVNDGAIEVNGNVVKEWSYSVKRGDTIRVGKGKFIRIED